MRHWLLQSQQESKYQKLQEAMLRRNIALCPPSSYNTVKHTTTPFLGQNVVFRALNPYAAVSILTTIADEEFFEGIITSENEGNVEDVYEKLKRLVLLAWWLFLVEIRVDLETNRRENLKSFEHDRGVMRRLYKPSKPQQLRDHA